MNKKSNFFVIFISLTILIFNYTVNSYAAENLNVSKLYCNKIIPGVTLENDIFNTFKNVIKKTVNSDNTYSYYFNNSNNEKLFEIITLSPAGKVIYADISSHNLQIENIKEVKKIIGEPKSYKKMPLLNNALTKFSQTDYDAALYPEYGVLFVYSKQTGNIKHACYFEKCNLNDKNEYYARIFENIQI